MLQIEVLKPDLRNKLDYFHPAIAQVSEGR